jgi:drug/metabolite transporter (DMT)-like permease
MNWNMWLKGLAAAVAGGAVMAGGQVVTNRMQNGKAAPAITGGNVGISAGLGAVVTLIAYMMQSPMPIAAPASSPASAPPA